MDVWTYSVGLALVAFILRNKCHGTKKDIFPLALIACITALMFFNGF